MHDVRLKALLEELQRRGVEPGELPKLQAEIDALEAPAPLWSRIYTGATGFAQRQWARAMGEARESGELAQLISRAARGDTLSRSESARVRAQLADLVRVVPAGLIAAAIEVVPVPGTSVATPWVLAHLGLMPSHWREAHLLDQLRKESERLRADGEDGAAEQVDALRAELESEAEQRAAVEASADPLLHWDENGDGRWDPPERERYEAWLNELVELAETRVFLRSWFLMSHGHVFGHVALVELADAETLELLVRLERRGNWVSLGDLLARMPEGWDVDS